LASEERSPQKMSHSSEIKKTKIPPHEIQDCEDRFGAGKDEIWMESSIVLHAKLPTDDLTAIDIDGLPRDLSRSC
jgi:hypothetical protein